MATNVILKNRKAVEILFRTSQRCNRSTIAGSNHLDKTSVVSSKEHSNKASIIKEGAGSSAVKMNFSNIASRALGAQSAATVPKIEFNDALEPSRNIWTQVLETNLPPQLEKMFLLGNNVMITTYETDASKVIYHNGKHEFALPSTLANIRCAARFSDGSFVLCSRANLAFFSNNCDYLGSSKLATGHPYAMTVDARGLIFVAMLGTNIISIYNQDGSFNRIFRTESSPLNLAVSNDRLVVAFVDGTVQLINHNNPSATTTRLEPPAHASMETWQPTRVCCSNHGDIFVSDWRQGAVYKYSANGDYQMRVCEDLRDPQDITVSGNGEELQVFESGLSGSVMSSTQDPCVKTFRLI